MFFLCTVYSRCWTLLQILNNVAYWKEPCFIDRSQTVYHTSEKHEVEKQTPYTSASKNISYSPFLCRILKPSSLQHYIQTHLTNTEHTRVQPVVFTFRASCARFLLTSRGEKRQPSQQVCRVFEDAFPRLRGCSSFVHEKTTLTYIWHLM